MQVPQTVGKGDYILLQKFLKSVRSHATAWPSLQANWADWVHVIPHYSLAWHKSR